MNADRIERRYRILVEAFYSAKSRHLGLDRVLKSGRFCETNLRDMMRTEEASFDEVKQALTWVFVTDRSKHWASALTDIAGFCKAYRTICDQLDAHMPTPAATSMPATGGPRDGADHIASAESKAEAEARFASLTGEAPTLTVVPDADPIVLERALKVAERAKSRNPRPDSTPTPVRDLPPTVPRKDLQ